MGSIFNLDNPIWTFMGKVADLIILNVLAIICSLPIVTIGASWTALYYVTIRMVRKEESYIIRDFFRSFKENFKQATIIWLLALAAIVLFVVDMMLYQTAQDQLPKLLMIAILIWGYLILGTIIYAFPLLSRFHNTIRGTIKNAFLLSLAHVPYTIILVILFLLPFLLSIYMIELLSVIIMLGFSVPAYIASIIWVRIFRKFEPEEIAEDEPGQEMEPEESVIHIIQE